MTEEKMLNILAKIDMETDVFWDKDKERIAEVMVGLRENIRDRNYRANGKAALARVTKMIIKNAKQTKNSKLYGAWVDNGVQYMTDTHMLLALYKPLDLPEAQGSEDAARMFEMERREQRYEVMVPENLKAEVKIKKAEKKRRQRIFVTLGDGEAAVNAEYLLALVEALDVSTVTLRKDNPGLRAVCGGGEDGEFILLPISPGQEKHPGGYFWVG